MCTGLWSCWARARLVNSDQKSGVLVSSTGVRVELSKGHIKGQELGGRGDSWSQGLLGSHIKNLHLLGTLRAAL